MKGDTRFNEENPKKAKKRTFLHDAIDFVALGAHSLEEDDFSNCFKPISPYEIKENGIAYAFSFIVRYFILFPLRIMILFIGIFFIAFLFLYGTYFKKYNTIQASFLYFNKLVVFLLNFKITHVGEKCIKKVPHLYVSNHTSFIDYVVLSSHKFSHAFIAEGHGGLFGFLLTQVLEKNGSIGFKRCDKQDRAQVLRRIKKHIESGMAPMLIFPEGTCVNNESILLFQKGAFELDTLICPVGIKYKKEFADPYWNRRVHNFTLHSLYLLTRWGVEVEVHWMNPKKRKEEEDAIMFAHRIKTEIAQEMDLRNTIWNGYFKSSPVLKDREILKNCFLNIYWKAKKEELEEQAIKDRERKMIYLLDENIDTTEKDDRLYFDKLSYRRYVNECCKEYLRIKAG